VSDQSCLFCNETETTKHLMFKCTVAKLFWRNVEKYFGINIGEDFESITCWWISEKCNRQCVKHCVVCTVFSGQSVDIQELEGKMVNTLKSWSLIYREENKKKLQRVIESWEVQATMKPAILEQEWWTSHKSDGGSSLMRDRAQDESVVEVLNTPHDVLLNGISVGFGTLYAVTG
jgi:hypothetical protein